MLRRLWKDEYGAVVSMEIVVIASVLIIALLAGWALLRGVMFVELNNQAEWIAGGEHEEHIEEIEIDEITTCADVFGNNGEGDGP